MDKFPLKRPLNLIARVFNSFFKKGEEVYTYGLEHGWLDQQMDFKELGYYEDTPYHFRNGLGAHRGKGSIEEGFLMKDAFNIRVKAERYYDLLMLYGEQLKKKQEEGKDEFTSELYSQIAEIKFEVCAFSRLTIVSFYSFIERFINCVGHSYHLNNDQKLSNQEVELLK